MQFPTREEALQRIRELATDEAVEVDRRAWRDAQNLGYVIDDICDMLYELEPTAWEKLEKGHHTENPVATFRTTFLPEDREAEQLEGDELFVEVEIRSADLRVRACKLYGSPG